MSALFYPTLTDKMLDDSATNVGVYEYSFKLQGHYEQLKSSGRNKIKLEPSEGDWQLERDGLRIKKTVVIEVPQCLYGPKGVAPKDSSLGMNIIWSNPSLTQMGVIKPVASEKDKYRHVFCFEHEFLPGEISGNLQLRLYLYIDTPAEVLRENEEDLMNERGVQLGLLEEVVLNLSNDFLDFPTREISDPKQPLWWLELKDWEDPISDAFDNSHIQLIINNKHKASGLLFDEKKGLDLLIEIVSTSYFLIVAKIAEMGRLQNTLDNVDLGNDSISKFIYKFYLDCNPKFYANQPAEDIQKIIHDNIDRILRGEETQE